MREWVSGSLIANQIVNKKRINLETSLKKYDLLGIRKEDGA